MERLKLRSWLWHYLYTNFSGPQAYACWTGNNTGPIQCRALFLVLYQVEYEEALWKQEVKLQMCGMVIMAVKYVVGSIDNSQCWLDFWHEGKAKPEKKDLDAIPKQKSKVHKQLSS